MPKAGKKSGKSRLGGVDIATGHGKNIWELDPRLEAKVKSLYEDAKISLRAELAPAFVNTIPNALPVGTLSKDRDNYISQRATGEKPNPKSIAALKNLRDSWGANLPKGQIVISDGLNAKAIMDEGHLAPYLDEVRKMLADANVPMSETNIVVTSGRVRAGYRIGERPGNHAPLLFGLHNGNQGQNMGRKENRSRYHETRVQYRGYGPGPQESGSETITIIREMVGRQVNNSRLLGKV